MLKLFISYCHKDELLKNELLAHLSPLLRNKDVVVWHDRFIDPGEEIDNAIRQNLHEADIILLLISSDFINSDYCYSNEMKFALLQHEKKTKRVIPIILRPCVWQESPFSKLNCLPTDATPVTTYSNKDEAYSLIARGVDTVVKNIKKNLNGSISDATTFATDAISQDSKDNSQVFPLPKSLKLPAIITDHDRHKFTRDGYSYIEKSFQNWSRTLQSQNERYVVEYEKIANQAFKISIYQQGGIVAGCYIRLENNYGQSEQILYSNVLGGFNINSGFNQMLALSEDKNGLHFEAPMSFERDKCYDFQSAAEYLWEQMMSTIESKRHAY